MNEYPHKTKQLPDGTTIELTPRMQLADTLHAQGHIEDAPFANAALARRTPLGDAKEAALLRHTYEFYEKITTRQAIIETLRECRNPLDISNLEHARIQLAAKELGGLLKAQGVDTLKETTLTAMAESAILALHPKHMTPAAVRG